MRTSPFLFPSWGFEPSFPPSASSRENAGSHIEENEQGYFLEIDAPGVKKDDLRISLENHVLLVEGERKGKVATKFRRAFSVPEDVDVESIAAHLEDGVLQLVLPKAQKAKPRVISIREGKSNWLGKSEDKSSA